MGCNICEAYSKLYPSTGHLYRELTKIFEHDLILHILDNELCIL